MELIFKFTGFKIKTSLRKLSKLSKRYVIDQIHSKSLEGNPLGSPADRKLRIYLPPGYYESGNKRYPVIYVLHGNNAGNGEWTFTSRKELGQSHAKSIFLAPRKLVKEAEPGRFELLFYEDLDAMIEGGDLPPFIVVQPDASLQLNGGKGPGALRGSLYVNSAWSGNYRDYIMNDVMHYIDENYRTIPEMSGRAIVGGSMGGFGALYYPVKHPGTFTAACALNPLNFDDYLKELVYVSPLDVRLFGRETAERNGVVKVKSYLQNFYQIVGEDFDPYNVSKLVKEDPSVFKETHLYLFCEEGDEFGLDVTTRNLHDALVEAGVDHEFEVGSDPRNAISPHTLGSMSRTREAIAFCTGHFDH